MSDGAGKLARTKVLMNEVHLLEDLLPSSETKIFPYVQTPSRPN
jgi:hypothetical protein